MTIDRRILVLATAVAGLSLSGCVSSPTYGTDKSAGAQLFDDVSNIVPLGTATKKDPIDYKPRPELVRPASGQVAHLPAPQEKVTQSGAAWPESPEQRRKRLRDEATANQDNPFYRPAVKPNVPANSTASYDYDLTKPPTKRVAEAKKELHLQKVGAPDQRRYLSEPPLAYRQPAATAPIGEQGDDEAKKERARKKAASKSKSWSDYMPWN
ncbi:hypothetical protein ACI0FM_05675 [Paenochrobactrum sp. BZR 588]|uniref:hypothetical protein n=1 Tax=Paenochrobactrum TaxID=999488 RepID=UPI0035BBBE80